MTEKANWSAKLLTWVCVGVMILALCSIGLRIFTSTILVEKLGMNNAFAELVFFDAKGIIATGTDEEMDIDWAELYPFAEEDIAADTTEETEVTLADRLKAPIQAVEQKFETYSTEHLMGYTFLTERERAYQNAIQWDFFSYGEYNGIIKLEENYFAGFCAKHDVTEAAESTAALASFCETQDIDFLYIQLPFKISKFDDPDLSGSVDFSNQNADDFLRLLDKNDVDYYDLRETIHEEGLNHRDLFYETDHHWKAETGLWAAGEFLDQLALRGYDVESAKLAPELFDYVVYPDWFFGSQGKKVTLALAEPEDFTLITPSYDTNFHYYNPDVEVNETGDFSVMLDMSQFDNCDYLRKSAYHTYNYGDRPLIQIENLLLTEDTKVLIIHDSFSDPLIAFLSLGIKEVDALDIRSFTGSVKSYIEQTKPDMVIVTYNPNALNYSVDWSVHTDLFDFR